MKAPVKRKLSAAAITQLRRAKTAASSKFSIGGTEKRKKPAPITLRLPPEKR